jgi:cation transport ATPase
MMPDEAERLTGDGDTETVKVTDLEVGDIVLVRPGARVPADGEIVEGAADVDESMITGESTPVSRGEGERVVAATVVADASLRVRVDAVGDDTTLAGIQKMVEQAQQSKSKTQRLAEHRVADTATTGDIALDEVLRLAGAVEADSEHPLARAIHGHARDQVGELPTANGFTSMTGRGVKAEVDGHSVAGGGPALLRDRELTVPDDLEERVERWRERGAAILYVVRDGAVIGALALEDQVREVSRQAIAQLHDAGVTVAMITGDARQVADAVAAELDIDEVFAEVLPVAQGPLESFRLDGSGDPGRTDRLKRRGVEVDIAPGEPECRDPGEAVERGESGPQRLESVVGHDRDGLVGEGRFDQARIGIGNELYLPASDGRVEVADVGGGQLVAQDAVADRPDPLEAVVEQTLRSST